MGDLNLRSFMFSKWVFITRMARGLEKTHLVSRLYQKRAVFRHWRSVLSSQGSGTNSRSWVAPASSVPLSGTHPIVTAAAGHDAGRVNQDSFNSNASEASKHEGLKISMSSTSSNSKASAPHASGSERGVGTAGVRASGGGDSSSWSSKLVRLFRNAA